MADYFWPQSLTPSAQSWKIVDNVGMFSSPLSGATRTVSRAGVRLGCTITVPTLTGANRHRMLGLISALAGRTHRIWVPDFSTALRGSFPAAELLGNSAFSTTSGWTSSSAELGLYADSGRLRLTRTAVAANQSASAPAVTASGARYLFRAGVVAGYGATNCEVRLGTTAGGAEIATSGAKTSGGLYHASGAATGTASFGSILDISTGRAADHFQLVDTPSFARCAAVSGASQSGSGLLLSGLPPSTQGLLAAGDVVAVFTTTWEMKRVVADLNSNASGLGYMKFEPPLRSSPANGAPIAIYRPMAKFMLAENGGGWETAPGMFSDFTLDLIEDVT